MEKHTITDLAQAFGVTLRTLRFYEDVGLLRPQRQGQARIYDKRDKARLRFILRCKRLGFALSQLRELLELYDGAQQTPQQATELLSLLAERRAALELQQQDLQAVLDEMRFFETQLRQRLSKL